MYLRKVLEKKKKNFINHPNYLNRNIEGFDPFTNDWKNIIENTPVLDKV